MIGQYFYYNKRRSSDFEVSIVRINTGLVTVPFLSDREIVSESIAGNPIPYVYDVRENPLVVKLTLSTLDESWTIEKRREIARWLDIKKFAEFYSEDDVNKRYYLMYQGGIDLSLDSELKGYIEVEFLNISPYSYSPIYEKIFDFSSITIPTIFELKNLGDTILKPEMWIYKIGTGDISIKNLSDGGREFKFTGLLDKETVYIDNKNRYIESDISGIYRYDNFNNNYLELLPYSVNRLEITGRCELKFKIQYELKG